MNGSSDQRLPRRIRVHLSGKWPGYDRERNRRRSGSYVFDCFATYLISQNHIKEGAVLTKYVISGGKPLHGEVEISGAKNAAVAILPAALLVDGVCRIENVPNISDVTMILGIMRDLGANVRMINQTTVELDCSHVYKQNVPYELARQIRASYYLIGALLGRFGRAEVPPPGGCDLGVRPIDQHLKGFSAMGAEIQVENGFIYAASPTGRLHGAQIYLDVVSVGATMEGLQRAAARRMARPSSKRRQGTPYRTHNFPTPWGLTSWGPGPTSSRSEGWKSPGRFYPSSPTRSRRAIAVAKAMRGPHQQRHSSSI